MSWIKISDELEVYSISDDMWDMFNYITYFLSSFSPFYYFLLGIGFFLFVGIGLAWRVGVIGKRFVRKEFE